MPGARLVVICDWDGTLVQTAQRYHVIHSALISHLDGTPLSFDAYLEHKRLRTPETDIARQCGLDARLARAYARKRVSCLELPEYLAYDHMTGRTIMTVNAAKDIDWYILTSRRHRSLLLDQVTRFGLRIDKGRIFNAPVQRHKRNAKFHLAAELIRRLGKTGCWMIGDSQGDINIARHLGVNAGAVTGGAASEEELRAQQPAVIGEDFTAVIEAIRKREGLESVRA